MATHVEDVIFTASSIVLGVAIVINAFFIFIALTRTRRCIGVYKYMMICFAVANIMYSSVEFLSKPIIYIYGTSYMAYNKGFFHDLKPWAFLLLCLFIAMYGMNTALLALHFIYRYIVLCRAKLLIYFHRPIPVLIISIGILSWGLIYGLVTYYCFAPNEDFYRYAGPSASEKLGLDIRRVSFFCVFPHERIGDETIIHWSPAAGLFVIVLLMAITYVVMVVCGIKVHRTLKASSISQKSKKLQTEMLRALIAQATIPFFMSYLPRLLMFFFVVMGYPPLKIFSCVPLIVTMNTVLDPIAIMFFVHDYREAVFCFSGKRGCVLCRTGSRTESGTSQKSRGVIHSLSLAY